ncbi:MAG: hypothetical protein WDM70_06500 [Nitrosomonadales bacterium]
MSTLNLEQFSTYLQQLNFNLLFTDVLGWNHPPVRERAWQDDEAKDIRYKRRWWPNSPGWPCWKSSPKPAGRTKN